MTKVSPEKKSQFLQLIKDGAWVKDAADAIGIAERTAYEWRDRDPDFDREWTIAADLGDRIKLGIVEKEMQRRAVDGVAEPKYWQDKVVGHVQKYSDTLLIVRAKALAPERYSERYHLNATSHSTITVRAAPDYDLFRDAILTALRPFPEAQRAVAAAMMALEQRAIEGDTEANGAAPPHS